MKLEEILVDLEETITSLEREDISLEDSFKEYQKGMEMIKLCNTTIDKIEKEVQLIMDDGSMKSFSNGVGDE
ncbi:MAG: exodeoxyribonuclease VII small subunit [Lachnospiraceae bacterium]|nr:exodeoxyribonuclease VII small subunit [Lachnospiraceae bacterium]